jgi:hypothetical protein
MKDNTRNGSMNLYKLTPETFIAVSSFRFDILPVVKRQESKTATGRVSFIISGVK